MGPHDMAPIFYMYFFDSLGARVRAIGARAVYSITSLTILVVWCAAIPFSLSETGAEFTL